MRRSKKMVRIEYFLLKQKVECPHYHAGRDSNHDETDESIRVSAVSSGDPCTNILDAGGERLQSLCFEEDV